jgi:hypothetical protein
MVLVGSAFIITFMRHLLRSNLVPRKQNILG